MSRPPVILNVEDDESTAYIVSRVLKNVGYGVVGADTGAKALEQARALEPDLIVLDVKLPDVSGFEVCRQLKSDPATASIPILHLSASFLDTESQVRGLEGGADAYLTKPFEPPVLIATIRALLRLKEAERSARELSAQWQTTFDAIADGIAVLDSQGCILRCNLAFGRIFKQECDSLTGKSWLEVTAQDADAPNPFERMQTTGKRQTIQASFQERILEFVFDRLPAIPPKTPDGVCIVSDITERKRFESRMQHAQKLESLGVLAGGIAHDFNNLLTGILGNASLVMDSLPTGHESRSLVNELITASESAATLTRQMLAYAGKGRFESRKLDLSALVRNVLPLLHGSVPRNVSLDLRMAEGLPVIEADAAQIQQIVMNLVLNGAEAVAAGNHGAVSVTTSEHHVEPGAVSLWGDAIPPGCYVAMDVQDNGSGIEPHLVERIFDPFFTTKFVGRGLGLSAVQGIVRSHRGALQLRTGSGGSCFRVMFPCAGAALMPAAQETAVHESRAVETVLIADDEETVLNVARRALERQGYRTVTCKSGAEAVDILFKNKRGIAVAILDFSMPGMNGIETLRRLREIDPGLKVVVSSGFTESELQERYPEMQTLEFLQKPYSASRLIRSVDLALKNPK